MHLCLPTQVDKEEEEVERGGGGNLRPFLVNMQGVKSLTYIKENVLLPKLETLSRHH